MESPHPASGTDHPTSEAAHPAPDVEALSEKVYRLMLADLRLETARIGPGSRRG